MTVKKSDQVLVAFLSGREDCQLVALTNILAIVLLPSADKYLVMGHGGSWWYSFEQPISVYHSPWFC